MLNGQWLNAGPLNSSGISSTINPLAANATAAAVSTAPSLHRAIRLGVTATATAAANTPDLARRRSMPLELTATAMIFGGMSVRIGGIQQQYLAAFSTATGTIQATSLSATCPLVADATASAETSAALYPQRRLTAAAAALASIDQPFIFSRVNLGDLPPGQDSIIGSRRIRAFGFASAEMKKRKALSILATATATLLPRLSLTGRLAANASAHGETVVTLYVRRTLVVDATATAAFDQTSLFTYARLAANMDATATLQPTLYMNTFDVAPTVRTVYVGSRPRTAVPTRIRREVDA